MSLCIVDQTHQISVGQWASTRSDMFPESLCSALTQLHNDAPSHSWKHTKKVMESSLGLPPNTLLAVFDSFDTKPLASGSIAQVHRASLNGTTIVAKVRHPNVAKLIDMDFRLMRMAAVVADCLPSLSWLHVRETVDQFSHTMAAQAHLNVEGHHLEVLNYNFRSWNHVKFPKPVYATSAVIIETFESGQIVTTILDAYDAIASQVALEQGTLTVEEVDEMNDAEESKSHGYQFVPMSVAKFIVSTGLSLYLKMLLVGKSCRVYILGAVENIRILTNDTTRIFSRTLNLPALSTAYFRTAKTNKCTLIFIQVISC